MKRLLYFIICIIFIACEVPNFFVPVPYYRFDSTAKKWLSKINQNDSLKFIGSDGSKINFAVYVKESKKYTDEDCSFLFGKNCTQYYHYDETYVSFSSATNKGGNFRIYMRFDTTINKKDIPKGTVAKAKIQGEFHGFNSKFDFPYLNFPDIYSISKFETFTNATKTYKNVIIINSGRTDPIIDRWFKYERNISEVGFDIEYGIVYFKDLKGTIWKKVN